MRTSNALAFQTQITLLVRARRQREIAAILQDRIARLVLREVAIRVGEEIASRIPPGFEPLKQVWLSEPQPVMQNGRIVAYELGNVEQLNAAMPARAPAAVKVDYRSGTQWRFGQWFNVEWGVEWPHFGKRWLYQENPGAARSPQDSANRPPGATLADIDMRQWLKKVRPRGRSFAIKRSGKGYAPGKSRFNRAAAVEPLTDMDRMLIATGSRSARDAIRGRPVTRDPETEGFRGEGQFGAAPIRIGMIMGANEMSRRIPGLLKNALRQAGGGR